MNNTENKLVRMLNRIAGAPTSCQEQEDMKAEFQRSAVEACFLVAAGAVNSENCSYKEGEYELPIEPTVLCGELVTKFCAFIENGEEPNLWFATDDFSFGGVGYLGPCIPIDMVSFEDLLGICLGNGFEEVLE